MGSSQVIGELQVSDDGLRVDARWCEALAAKLAGDCPPTGAATSPLGSAAAINVVHMQVAAAGVSCTVRAQATATKLVAAATGYAANEANSAAEFGVLDRTRVSRGGPTDSTQPFRRYSATNTGHGGYRVPQRHRRELVQRAARRALLTPRKRRQGPGMEGTRAYGSGSSAWYRSRASFSPLSVRLSQHMVLQPHKSSKCAT